MVFEKWGDPSYVLVCSEDAVNDRFLPPSDLSVRLLGQTSPPSWLHFLLLQRVSKARRLVMQAAGKHGPTIIGPGSGIVGRPLCPFSL